ncbi:TA system antitoxin ParD family protein [Fusobacterium necrophorum]|uniref:TA system antitoxin ParD family protein n=1 Tax=Fusobacterium necrophorum TaxID=859 RepID=UPI00370F2A99
MSKKIALQLRLDEELHQKVKEIAEKELRSINAQLEYFILKGIENFEKNQQEH